MGVFVPSSPFPSLELLVLELSSAQVLFLVGGIAISVGIFTYSFRVMATVGNDLFKLNPATALVVVLAESLVLFIFASRGLERWLVSNGLPAIPLVPVSSSQAVIGAVVGVSLARGGRGLHLKILARVASGWVTTPAFSTLLAFVLLYFMQNVFELAVHQ
jgi:PiT family inorganic phosphate transporter